MLQLSHSIRSSTIAYHDMAKELLSDNSSESSDSEAGGADIGESFKVNQKYAERFEYNKKREERAKCEYHTTKSVGCLLTVF